VSRAAETPGRLRWSPPWSFRGGATPGSRSGAGDSPPEGNSEEAGTPLSPGAHSARDSLLESVRSGPGASPGAPSPARRGGVGGIASLVGREVFRAGAQLLGARGTQAGAGAAQQEQQRRAGNVDAKLAGEQAPAPIPPPFPPVVSPPAAAPSRSPSCSLTPAPWRQAGIGSSLRRLQQLFARSRSAGGSSSAGLSLHGESLHDPSGRSAHFSYGGSLHGTQRSRDSSMHESQVRACAQRNARAPPPGGLPRPASGGHRRRGAARARAADTRGVTAAWGGACPQADASQRREGSVGGLDTSWLDGMAARAHTHQGRVAHVGGDPAPAARSTPAG
jgi:hypothetical protein